MHVIIMVITLIYYQIQDVRGNDEVTLSRKFGDEKYVFQVHMLLEQRNNPASSSIRIMFSIADVQSEEEFDDPELDSEEQPQGYPLRASLSITKVRSIDFPYLLLFLQY